MRSDLDFRGEDEVVDDLDRSAAQHRHADRQAEEVEEIEGSQVPTPQHGMASICCVPRTADTQRWQHCMLAWAAAGPDTACCIQGHPAINRQPAPRLPHAPCLPPRLRRPLRPILIVPLIPASLMTRRVCMFPLCLAPNLCPHPFPVPYLPRPM